MGLPRVSVVVPVHNGRATVASALASLQAQTLAEIEILVVDDHSTDDTPSLLQQLKQSDPRIQFIRLPHNQGVQAARAAGLLQARAPWIAFLDADDHALPIMLARLLNVAESTRADIVICGSLRVTPAGRSLGPKVRFPRQASIESGLFERFCHLEFGTGALWNKLYRADLIRRWGCRTHRWTQNGTEDTLVNIGCFWEARRVITLPDVLHHYVLQPDSLTSSLEAERGFFKIVQAFAIAVDLYAPLGSRALAGIVDLYRSQLAYPSYALLWQDNLPPWADPLTEPLQFLARDHPRALALLLARLPLPERPSVRSRFRRLWHRFRHGRDG